MIPPRIQNVKALDNFILELAYISKETKYYDMKKKLTKDFYKNLNNKDYFAMVKTVETTVEWPNR